MKSQYPDPLSPAVEVEGAPRRSKRPKTKQVPIKTLLRQLASAEDQIVSDPVNYDPSVGDKVILLGARILFERFVFADEEEIPLKQKIALAIQIAQFLESSKAPHFAKGANRYPNTAEAIEQEIAKREANMAKLLPYVKRGDPGPAPAPKDVERAIEALRPPEEV